MPARSRYLSRPYYASSLLGCATRGDWVHPRGPQPQPDARKESLAVG